MSVFKVRRVAHPEADGLAAETAVFVAPQEGRTYQNAGSLKLTKAEADDLAALIDGKAAEPGPDFTAEEYNKLMEFLLEWADNDLTALYLADMVRRKFGASARRAHANGQG